MLVIGITGNTGSGKGEVARILQKMGGFIIDADKLNHECMLRGNLAYDEIVEIFGSEILKNGEIDRKLLGSIVFSDTEKLKVLEKIAHKYVKLRSNELIDNKKTEYENGLFDGFIVIDAPLLIEAAMDSICDSVWLITAKEETRLSRIIQRDRLSCEEAKIRMKSQPNVNKLKEKADYIIENNDSIENLTKWVAQCFMSLTEKK